MTDPAARLTLVADIGGTNTRVALAQGGVVDTATIRRYGNAGYEGLAPVLARYLEDSETDHARVGGVCVAAAGPVRDGTVQLTNLGWSIDRTSLAEALTAETCDVLNDLQAQGHAIGNVTSDHLVEVVSAAPQPPHATKLVVGIGTGFNACPVFELGDARFVPPAEAGHVALPAAVPGLADVLPALRERGIFPSVEEVLSGRGVSNLHAALHGREEAPADILGAMQARDPAALETGRLFVTVMGHVTGDLALSHLPFGGIYLIGGVTRAFAPWLAEFGFLSAFRDKGRFSGFMDQFAVTIVTDDYAALSGCAAHLERIRNR